MRRARRPVALVVSTVLMWLCYVLMAHLPFVMLGMTDAYGLTLLDTWAIMALGALGIVVPSPGGVGSYHYITIQTLVHLFAVDEFASTDGCHDVSVAVDPSWGQLLRRQPYRHPNEAIVAPHLLRSPGSLLRPCHRG